MIDQQPDLVRMTERRPGGGEDFNLDKIAGSHSINVVHALKAGRPEGLATSTITARAG